MKMRRIILVVFAAAMFFCFGCDDLLSDLLKFNGEWYPFEFSIEPEDEVGNIVLASDEYDANIDSLFEAEGLSRENLKSVKISDAEITVITAGHTFDPVTSVELVMETPGLGSKRVAWLDTVPRGVTTIELDLSSDDLQEYLMEETFEFTVSGFLETRVSESVNFEGRVRYVFRGGLGE
jgi:hypothetical protein